MLVTGDKDKVRGEVADVDTSANFVRPLADDIPGGIARRRWADARMRLDPLVLIAARLRV